MKMTKKEFLQFSSPSLIVMVVLMIVPLIYSLVLSLCTYTYGQPMKFVGFNNYINVLTNERIWDSMGFTFILTLITVPLTMVIGLAIAIMLTRIGSKFFRTVLISGVLVPFAIAPVVSTLLFSWLFKDNWGVVSDLLTRVGIEISWFSDVLPAQTLVMMHTIWAGVAFVALVLYAGLLAMPQEPIKAAEVEGSSFLQKLRYVILPYLSPLMLYCTTINIMDRFRTYDSVAVMTKGGPGLSTETVSLYSYRVAFSQLNLGQSATISILMIIAIFILIGPCLYLMRKETVTTEKKVKKTKKADLEVQNG